MPDPHDADAVPPLDDATRTAIEAAAFRALRRHLLEERPEVQNIDLMTLAGFCRNCLARWMQEAAAERGVAMGKDAARALFYGMPHAEWAARHQRAATPAQQAAFASRPPHGAIPAGPADDPARDR